MATEPDAFGGAKGAILSGPCLVALLRDDVAGLPFRGLWDLPGGGREAGEVPFGTLARELREEVGLVLDPARIVWGRHYGGAPGTWFFVARWDGLGDGALRLGDEGRDCRMMPVAEFLGRADAVPHLQARLRDYLADRAG